MNNRIRYITVLLVLLVSLTGNARAISSDIKDQPSLVYVELSSADDLSRFATTQLPMYANLMHGLLTGADQAGQQVLREAGLSIVVLDPDLSTGTYYLASSFPSRPAPDFASFGQVLLHQDNGVLLRMDASRARALAEAGAELQSIRLTPNPLYPMQTANVYPKAVDPDPFIQGMIDQVTETQVYTYDRQLAGELPIWLNGSGYTIPTRYTYSGIPIQKTTSYVGQHLAGLGMEVDYHVWNNNSNPDVIGEIPGQVNSQDIYIIGGHLDDVGGVPGADDNASGSVAALMAADILSQYQWGCTLRFAFWTGEEQGLDGSGDYALEAHTIGENILGYLNLDMIAWNTIGSLPTIYLGYRSSVPGSLALANLFSDVVDAYNIDLLPTIGTSYDGSSDHTSFLNQGYPAILGIEGSNDMNPYYHTAQDTPAHTDPAYFTNFVKASIASFAHMSGCLIPTYQGTLDGYVTTAGDGSPILGASVSAVNSQGQIYPATTNLSGYYTQTLPVDTYTVTASANGYAISDMTNVQVVSDTTTTVNFALEVRCDPITGLDFTWEPIETFIGDAITFTASASGTLPINYSWNFGDEQTGSGATVTHTYAVPGNYDVSVNGSNSCGNADILHMINIGMQWNLFLPIIDN